jgi:hypothetical protein
MSLIDANARGECEGLLVPLVRLLVELEAEDPVAGWVVPERGARERFDGLLEMVAVLERLRDAGTALDATRDRWPTSTRGPTPPAAPER